MKKCYFFFVAFLLSPSFALAKDVPPEEILLPLTFTHKFSEYKLPLQKNRDFFEKYVPNQKEKQGGEDAICSASKGTSVLETTTTTTSKIAWRLNTKRLYDFIEEDISPSIDRSKEDVRIFRDGNGDIQFEGEAKIGQQLNVDMTILFVQKAIQEKVTRIELPVEKIHPKVMIEAPEILAMGIKELISIGESDFSGSTWARTTNIEIGAQKFNGIIVPQGEIFSFNKRIGPIDSTQGYKRELVIFGEKVEKDYGGGICQVSSTAFRAALLAGLPIEERHPHSFAVSYYRPWGTDATIYPGVKDLKFRNDTHGAILVQTIIDKEAKKLRFLFYGTKDKRKVKIFGPKIGRSTSPLPPRHETSTDIPVGQLKRLSSAVAGFDASWIQTISPDPSFVSEDETEIGTTFYSFFSRYKPMRDWTIRGVEPIPDGPTI
jgi:vancomycin resistance protein YoaR